MMTAAGFWSVWGSPGGGVVPEQLHGDPGEILARTRQDGWEGIVAKRADSLYLPGQRTESPLTGPAPAADLRGACWVTPALVGEVAYSEYTHTGTLRHPRWKQLLADLTPSDL